MIIYAQFIILYLQYLIVLSAMGPVFGETISLVTTGVVDCLLGLSWSLGIGSFLLALFCEGLTNPFNCLLVGFRMLITLATVTC